MTEKEILEALSERLLDENRRLQDRIEYLEGIPRSGEFHARLGKEGLFGVFERMVVCNCLNRQMKGQPVIDNTGEPDISLHPRKRKCCFECGLPVQDERREFCNSCQPITAK